jgi:26S proteasome regulatory subunit N6
MSSSGTSASAMNIDNDAKTFSRFDDAVELLDSKSADDQSKALSEFRSIVDSATEHVKVREQAVYKIGETLAKLGRIGEIRDLLVSIRPFFSQVPKARTAKIVRTLIDQVASVPDTSELQADLCKESIAWCIQEKRTFLKQRIEARLANLLLQLKQYTEAIKLISRLVRQVKKIDDKILLVEIELIHSRVHLSLRNVPKAKGALTSARSSANATYCPPLLQSEIDLQAGILCAEEKDFKTAFSYFYEAFEGYNTAEKTFQAIRCLKYMLLSKIMLNQPSEVYTIINGKAGVTYAGVDVEALKAIADAHKQRSIHAYQRVREQYKKQLVDDSMIASHLDELYNILLESNLQRLIEPYSRVEIKHVAKLIDLPLENVERKLSEMILDEKLKGTLDQGAGVLIVFDEAAEDETYDAALATIKELGLVVDKLKSKAVNLG